MMGGGTPTPRPRRLWAPLKMLMSPAKTTIEMRKVGQLVILGRIQKLCGCNGWIPKQRDKVVTNLWREKIRCRALRTTQFRQ